MRLQHGRRAGRAAALIREEEDWRRNLLITDGPAWSGGEETSDDAAEQMSSLFNFFGRVALDLTVLPYVSDDPRLGGRRRRLPRSTG